MKDIHAVLFDMDGLLLDDERINIECCIELGREWGFELDPTAVARAVMGSTRATVVSCYARVLPEGTDAQLFFDSKRDRLHERFRREGVVTVVDVDVGFLEFERSSNAVRLEAQGGDGPLPACRLAPPDDSLKCILQRFGFPSSLFQKNRTIIIQFFLLVKRENEFSKTFLNFSAFWSLLFAKQAHFGGDIIKIPKME